MLIEHMAVLLNV